MRLPRAEPEAVGMRADRLQRIDTIVAEGLRRKLMPGCVVLLARRQKVVFLKAYGSRQLKPTVEPMTVHTVFDMASITKPMATATSVMKLIEQGKLELTAPVSKYIPEFAANGKGEVTVLQLLTHQAGLIPDNSIKDYNDGVEEAFKRIYNLKFYTPPGKKFVYTDVGFILLADLVKRVSGLDVNEFSKQHIFAPLGMRETGYLPGPPLRKRAALTEQRNGEWMQGEVHDPRAFRLGGIAGHAGLFSTAQDIAVYAAMMKNGGQLNGVRILKADTVRQMTDAYKIADGNQRGLGWDKQSGFSYNKGDLMSPSAFGHGGFTGTVLWMDPQSDLTFVFLSNRVHPNGKGSVNRLAARIATIAAASIDVPRKSAGMVPVDNGIDVLRKNDFAVLRGQKVGLITNHTGLAKDGRSTVELLNEAPNVTLAALFSPEHGFAGKLDIAKIGDSKDSTTGLKVHSLYGKTRTPTAEMLEDLDTLVFDIQDIGTRFYTYISTMRNAMEAAAKHKLRFVVLDRVNPINGVTVSGPVLDAGSESFVGAHTLPVRHGMTVGEIAVMLNIELGLSLNLHVVKVEKWKRKSMFDETGLVWTNPSPNMRCLTQALIYPGVGLLETTNISVGRGTDTPFEVIGAPWIDGVELAQALNRQGIVGARFVPIRFRPTSSKHANAACEGVNIAITNRLAFEPIQVGLAIAQELRRLYGDKWETKSLNRLLGSKKVLESILAGNSPVESARLWEAELTEFLKRRSEYRLYP
jgi:uncharacterized protein YbbC (DUF1343 family)